MPSARVPTTAPRPGTAHPQQGPEDLLLQARQAYRDVVADPKTYGPGTARLVEQARAVDAPEAVVHALRAQAWFERSHLGNEHARVLLDDAVRTARRCGLDGALSEVLITRAAVNHELGRLIPAQHDLDAAGRLNQGGGLTAELAFQQAILYQNLGRLSQAGALYEQILRDDSTPAVLVTKTANNYSIILTQRGQPEAAQRLIDRGSALAVEAGPHLTAVLASTRAWVSTQQGRLTQGLVEFAEAARLHTAAGLPLAEHYLEYVDALSDLRLLPEAYDVAVEAAEELGRHGIALMAGEGLLRVARLATQLNDLPAALRAAEQARDRFTTQRRTDWRARADVITGDIRLRSGDVTPVTLATVRRAAATLGRLGMVADAIDAHLTAGRLALALDRSPAARTSLDRAADLADGAPVLLRLKGHLARALAAPDHDRLRHCRNGLRDLARHRAAFASLEVRVRASGHGAELGQLGLQVLLRNGAPAQVLRWMEHTRAAAMMAVEPADDPGIDDELAELRNVQADLIQVGDQDPAESSRLMSRQRNIEDRIRRHTWSAESTRIRRTDREVSAAELRRSLAGRVLVEFGVLDGQVIAVVVDPHRTRVQPLGPLSDIRFQLDKAAFGLRRLARPGRSPAAVHAAMASVDHALLKLRDFLFDPLALAADTPLVISPPAGLRRVPWSALHPAPVFVVPAASFWPRTQQPQPGAGRVVLIAGPDLPGASEEVVRLRELHHEPTVLMPPDSTIDAVLPALASADLAHLACHGRLRSDNPAFSALQLHDGLLTLHEMETRHIAPHRMVLAACDSAVGTAYEGNEVLGFVSALMARGTRGLVASIVPVSDAASVALMSELHRQVRSGNSLGEALFHARSGLDREDPHEFVNWCAFNAYGAA